MEKLKSIGQDVLVVVVGVLVANLVQQQINKARLSAPATK